MGTLEIGLSLKRNLHKESQTYGLQLHAGDWLSENLAFFLSLIFRYLIWSIGGVA